MAQTAKPGSNSDSTLPNAAIQLTFDPHLLRQLVEEVLTEAIGLMDFRDDLTESCNLATANSDKADELAKWLSQWGTRIGAKLPQPNPQYRGKQ